MFLNGSSKWNHLSDERPLQAQWWSGKAILLLQKAMAVSSLPHQQDLFGTEPCTNYAELYRVELFTRMVFPLSFHAC